MYDMYSGFSGNLTPRTERQLAEICRPLISNGTLIVTVLPMQQQQGSVDCSLFAISFALTVAQIVNSNSLQLKEMRHRLATFSSSIQ